VYKLHLAVTELKYKPTEILTTTKVSCVVIIKYVIKELGDDTCAQTREFHPWGYTYLRDQSPTMCGTKETPETIFVVNIFKRIKEFNPALAKRLEFYRWENNCKIKYYGLAESFFFISDPNPTLRDEFANEIEFNMVLEDYFRLSMIFPKTAVMQMPVFVNAFEGFIDNLKINDTRLENVNFIQGKLGIFGENMFMKIDMHTTTYVKPIYDMGMRIPQPPLDSLTLQ